MANSLWDNIGGYVHLGLGTAGMVPAVGNIADAIDAGIYTLEGDAIGAGLSAAAAVPLVGLFAGAGKLGKGVRAAKATKYKEEMYGVDHLRKQTLKNFRGPQIKAEVFKQVDHASRATKEGLKKIDPATINESKELLKKELLSEASYKNWVQMHLMARTNKYYKRTDKLKSIMAPKEILKGHKEGYVKNLKNYELELLSPQSKTRYYKEITDRIDNTPVFVVPDKQAGNFYQGDYNSKIQGWYSPNDKASKAAILIKESTLKSRRSASIGLHELKHSAQQPYWDVMEEAYGKIMRDKNEAYRVVQAKLMKVMAPKKYKKLNKLLAPLDKKLNKLIAEETDFSKYVIRPQEASARFSQLRSGLPGKLDTYGELLRGFNPVQIKDLKKTVWAAAPIGALPASRWETLNKAFGEEE